MNTPQIFVTSKFKAGDLNQKPVEVHYDGGKKPATEGRFLALPGPKGTVEIRLNYKEWEPGMKILQVIQYRVGQDFANKIELNPPRSKHVFKCVIPAD